MAKGNRNAGKKDQQKKPTINAQAPKAPGAAPKVKTKETEKKEHVEEAVVMTENQLRTHAATNPGGLAKKVRTLSPDSQITAMNLLYKTVVDPVDPSFQLPLEVRKETNMLVAVSVICTLVDHSVNGDDSFAALMQKSEYKGLVNVAKAAGYDIEFPDIKALPAGKNEGEVLLPANKIKVGKEMKEQVKNEKKIAEGEKPELDPEKITSEEDLQKALNYIFVTKSKLSLTGTLLEGIEFMKKFRMHEAASAENADEAKAKFEAYNSGDWLDDFFKYVRPSVFFTGIGRGMANVIISEKNPIHAFIIFREAIKDKETRIPALPDNEIAYCVKSIVKWYANTTIESNQKAIEGLDAKKNAGDIEKCNARIAELNSAIEIITNASIDVVDSLLDNIGSKFTEDGSTLTPECQNANSIYNGITKSYYGKLMSSADYKNLDHNVQQYAGCIINMFRDPGSQLASYNLGNISELEERTEEEKSEIRKQAKKEWDERKKASEKNA